MARRKKSRSWDTLIDDKPEKRSRRDKQRSWESLWSDRKRRRGKTFDQAEIKSRERRSRGRGRTLDQIGRVTRKRRRATTAMGQLSQPIVIRTDGRLEQQTSDVLSMARDLGISLGGRTRVVRVLRSQQGSNARPDPVEGRPDVSTANSASIPNEVEVSWLRRLVKLVFGD